MIQGSNEGWLLNRRADGERKTDFWQKIAVSFLFDGQIPYPLLVSPQRLIWQQSSQDLFVFTAQVFPSYVQELIPQNPRRDSVLAQISSNRWNSHRPPRGHDRNVHTHMSISISQSLCRNHTHLTHAAARSLDSSHPAVPLTIYSSHSYSHFTHRTVIGRTTCILEAPSPRAFFTLQSSVVRPLTSWSICRPCPDQGPSGLSDKPTLHLA